jgi:dihydroorotate dehydrogenase
VIKSLRIKETFQGKAKSTYFERMYNTLLRPLLFSLSSDQAHEVTIKGAAWSVRHDWTHQLLPIVGVQRAFSPPSTLSTTLWGLTFAHPVGLAAGFDKEGQLVPLMERLGFSHLDVGSMTAKPSKGNPTPRSFRLKSDASLINRMGLNNSGTASVLRHLSAFSPSVPLSVNIAKTHDPTILGQDGIQDYADSLTQTLHWGGADLITLNVSCPNTAEGKTFEQPDSLATLLQGLNDVVETAFSNSTTIPPIPPILLKLSCDVDKEILSEIVDLAHSRPWIQGFVMSNTSTRRDGLAEPTDRVTAMGKGGLSGRAIASWSTQRIEWLASMTSHPIIGLGGISSAQDVVEKIAAGASLVQLYTGLVYEGPAIVQNIVKDLERIMRKKGVEHLSPKIAQTLL